MKINVEEEDYIDKLLRVYEINKLLEDEENKMKEKDLGKNEKSEIKENNDMDDLDQLLQSYEEEKIKNIEEKEKIKKKNRSL